MAELYEDFDDSNDLAENDDEYAALGSILSWDDDVDDDGAGGVGGVGGAHHTTASLLSLIRDRPHSGSGGSSVPPPDLVQYNNNNKDGCSSSGGGVTTTALPDLGFLSYAGLGSSSSVNKPGLVSATTSLQQSANSCTNGGIGESSSTSNNNCNNTNTISMFQMPLPTPVSELGQQSQQSQSQSGDNNNASGSTNANVVIQTQPQHPQQFLIQQQQSQQQQQQQPGTTTSTTTTINADQLARLLSTNLLQQQQQQANQAQQQQQQQRQMQLQQQQPQQAQQQQQVVQQQQAQQQQQQIQLPFTADPNAFLQQLQFAQLQQQLQVAQQAQAQQAVQQQQQQPAGSSSSASAAAAAPQPSSSTTTAAATATSGAVGSSIQEQLKMQFVQAQNQAAAAAAANAFAPAPAAAAASNKASADSCSKPPPSKKQRLSAATKKLSSATTAKKSPPPSRVATATSTTAASATKRPPDMALSSSQIVSASDTDGEASRKTMKTGTTASLSTITTKKSSSRSAATAPASFSAAVAAATITSSSSSAAAAAAAMDMSNMTVEEKAKANRDRNREHARNTRLRKKAYLEKLKTTVDELCRERDTLVSERAGAANLLVEMHNTRTEVLMSFFALRSTNEKRRELWSSILDDSCFACVMPVTPYRSFPSSEVQISKCQRTVLGIDGMIADTASLHVLLDSLVDRRRYPLGKIDFRYTLVTEEAVVAGNHMMARWVMTTTNAVQNGAKMEVSKQGMLCCRFNSAHKIIGLELMFDVMAFMLQLKQAAGTDGFSVIPNTVQTCQRTFDKPVVMTLAEPPYTIVQVNKLWEQMTGYTAEEVVGKASCGILQGAKTDQKMLEEMMQEIRFKRPTSSNLINFKKSGTGFRNCLLLFPLSTDSRITHYLSITDHVDDGASTAQRVPDEPTGQVVSQKAPPHQVVQQQPSLPGSALSLQSATTGLSLPSVMPQVVLASMPGMLQQQQGPPQISFSSPATAFSNQQPAASSVSSSQVTVPRSTMSSNLSPDPRRSQKRPSESKTP